MLIVNSTEYKQIFQTCMPRVFGDLITKEGSRLPYLYWTVLVGARYTVFLTSKPSKEFLKSIYKRLQKDFDIISLEYVVFEEGLPQLEYSKLVEDIIL
jgi:hypothetical protein